MVHIFQVGVGSGGMAALDLIACDPRVSEVTIVEPDVYKPHNVVRHLFPASAVGQPKARLARQWLLDRRDDLQVQCLETDLCDPAAAADIDATVRRSEFGVCAADNEPAKFHFNHLMLAHQKPWTLGEVLAGGIGGFVHCFIPGGPCYGCVASFLKRSVTTAEDKPVDYSQPGGVAETSIPASKTAISVIASLHAQITLARLPPSPPEYRGRGEHDFTSLLLTLEKVPGVFDEAYRPYQFRIPRAPACFFCGLPETAGDLDRQLNDALDRLGPR